MLRFLLTAGVGYLVLGSVFQEFFTGNNDVIIISIGLVTTILYIWSIIEPNKFQV